MNWKNCKVCLDFDNQKQIYQINKYLIFECNKCGFKYVKNSPNKKELDHFYSKKDIANPEIAEASIRSDAIKSLCLLEKYTKDKFLVDIGCGRGYFLDEARKRNWRAEGVDFSKTAISYARKVLKLSVRKLDILSNNIDEKYPLITLNQVIEHIDQPSDIIKSLRRLLKDKGLLYIATPNFSSLSEKMNKIEFDYYIPPEHLCMFNINSITELLESNGFKILYSKTWSYPTEFAGIIKKLFKRNATQSLTIEKYFIDNNYQNIEMNLMQRIKYLLFDKLFCNFFYKILNLNNHGSMLEIIAQKI